jgi:Concanavalin A-like lectin/glucanases superfamily
MKHHETLKQRFEILTHCLAGAFLAGAPTPGENHRSHRRRLRLLPALAGLVLIASVVSPASAQDQGTLTVVTTPTDACFSLSSSSSIFVVAECYGTEFGMFTVGDANFINGNLRLPGCSLNLATYPNYGAGLSASNLSVICANRGYRGTPPGLDFYLPPVTSGHQCKLQLFLHESGYDNTQTGKRVEDVSLPDYGIALATGLDLAVNASANTNAIDVVSYSFTSDGSPLHVLIYKNPSGTDGNEVLTALTLEDLTPGPTAPYMVVPPASTTNFVGRRASMYCVANGSSPLACQWQAGAIHSGVYTNVVDDGVNISGSTTPNLTFASLTLANQADYVLVITNSYGSVTNAVATVTVLPIPGPVAASGYASYLMTNYAPVAYWRLSDWAGYQLIYDSSPNMHDGIVMGYPTLGAVAPKAPVYAGFENTHTAMALPGPTNINFGGMVSSPLGLNNYTTNNVTMLAWVNPAANQAQGATIFFSRINNGTGSTDNQGFAFNTYAMSDGDMELGWCWNGWDYGIHSGLELPHKIWSMVALVITPTNTSLYILNTNGMRSFVTADTHNGSTGTSTPAQTAAETWNAPTYIGYDPFNGGHGRVFNGSLNELAVLPSALSSDQVLDLYARAVGTNGFPPTITRQPVGGSVGIGATKPLIAAASGTAPLYYQWQSRAIGIGAFTNLSDVPNISGSLSNILTISSFSPTNVGDYRLVVTNSWGTAISTIATLRTNSLTADNSYTYAIFTNGPIAYWRMNERAGSIQLADSSPAGGFDASALASATVGSAGPVPTDFPGFDPTNTCLQTTVVPSDDGYVIFPALNLNGPTTPNQATAFTITAWINPTDYQNPHAGIVMLKGTGNGGLNYSASFTDPVSGRPCLGYSWNGGDGGWNTGLQPPPGIWSFVALVVTATDETMYLFNTNGMSMSYKTGANTVGTEAFLQPGAIGADTFWMDWGGQHATFQGSIDEVAIFTKALSGSLLETLYGKAASISVFPVVIQQQPVSTAVVPGGTARFSVLALGTGISYQWQARAIGGGAYTNVTDGGAISGSATATLTINNASAANVAQYQVVLQNTLPSSATSVPVKLLLVTPQPPGLIGQWLTGSEDFTDKSGFTPARTHDGFIVGNGAESPYWASGDVPAGFSGSSYALDGNCAISITNSASYDAGYETTFDYSIQRRFTVAFWAKGFPPHGWHPLVAKGGENNVGWQVRADNNAVGQNPTFTLRGVAQNNDAGDGAPLNINDYQWHHFAGTWDSVTGIRKLYVDGVLEINIYADFGTVSAIGDANVMAVDPNHHLELGAEEALNFAPNYFAGQLFDVRMYNYALGAGEVQALINPPSVGAVALYLDSTNSIPVGQKEPLTLLIPAGANKLASVTVWITNNAPNVASLEGAAGNVLTVNFAAGAPNFQHFVLDTIGAGQIQLAAGADSGLTSANLAATVIGPQLIGQWLSGAADLTDKSGFKPGIHDGDASSLYVGDKTLSSGLWSSDVPAGYSGKSLTFDGSYGVAIHNSCSLNYEGSYQTTFDEDIADGFSVSFWVKETILPGWQPWVSKRGESNFGWKVRIHGGDNCPCFTMRETGSWGGNLDEPFNSSTRLDGTYGNSWHHYTATYDALSGVRKLYVDGKLDMSVLGNDFGPYGLAKPNYLMIGGYDNDANTTQGPTFGSFLTGKMFDVRMYNHVLDASEAQALAHPIPAALIAVADSPVIDQGQQGTVSVSLPAGANASQPVTVWVTNVNPALVSIAGAPGNVFSVTLAKGARSSLPLTLSGLSDGLAQIGFSASGFTSASATVHVLAPTRLLGHWFAGHTNVADHSGFSPAGTHNGMIVGTPANLSYSTDVPPGFTGQSVNLNNGNNAANVAVLITNTCSSDNLYAPTFDDAIYKKFSITFWAKQSSVFGGGWVPWITKYGENNIGFKIRQNGGHNGEAFTLRGTYLANTYDDAQGNNNINAANQWYHIAAVWDGYSGVRKMYVNGVLDTSIVITNDFGPFVLGRNHHLVIGAYENPAVIGPTTAASLASGTGYNGKLYDVRFYNYPLSPADVQTVMTPISISVLPAAPGVMHLSWPAASTIGYVPQTSSDLVNWTNSTLTVTTAGGQNTVTDTAGAGTLFYRLYLP